MRTVGVQEAKTNLSRLLKQVEAGEEVAITRAGRVVARLVRADSGLTRRWCTFEGRASSQSDAFQALGSDEVADWESEVL